jgi:hypothetical protein
LLKVTLNLYESDVEWLKDRKGWGYTEVIRDIIRREVNHLRSMEDNEWLTR